MYINQKHVPKPTNQHKTCIILESKNVCVSFLELIYHNQLSNTPHLSFARPRAKHQTNSNQLLDHFRRSLDCTEHVQQAVKPLGYP